ncbi:MAG: helix-turn-helix transcriptional regulator [Treponema sp.]|nr:helix-turn-helix transcriptional regulator [Treponema sp.]
MKEYRHKRGYSQVNLAERAGMSPQYIAMVEMCSKFPKPAMLERLAIGLGFETHRLFGVSTTPEEALSLLQQDIVNEMTQLTANMEQVVANTIKKTCRCLYGQTQRKVSRSF